MKKRQLITDFINSIIAQDRIYGENDCNLIACKIIDIMKGTSLYDSLHGKYDSIADGLKKSTELSGYRNILEPIKKYCVLVEDGSLKDNDLLLTEHKLGNRKYFSVTPYFNGYGLVADDDIWMPKQIDEINFTSVYRFKEDE